MFDKETFRQLSSAVESDLVSGRLHSALKLLSESLEPELSSEQKQRLATVRDDYDRLLHFMANGSRDESREAFYQRFVVNTFRILQEVRHKYYQLNQTDQYALTALQFDPDREKRLSDCIATLESTTDFNALDNLFLLVWSSGQLTNEEEGILRLFLMASGELTRRYVLSALGLALLHFFDASKLRLLAEHAASDDVQDRTRALVAICLATRLHETVLPLYPTLAEQISRLAEQKHLLEQLGQLQHQLILYQDSERLRLKMEKEILPLLIKASKERAKLGFDNQLEIDLTNPVAGLNLSRESQKRITQSAKEMFQMFKEGVDVNLHTFTSLKKFPFFSHVGHWLAPFDEQRPEVENAGFIRKFKLCDSDFYSLCCLTRNIPEQDRTKMMESIEQHSEEIEMQSEEVGVSPMQNVIQCLYRLLMRSPWSSLWSGVFEMNALLIHHPLFGPFLRQSPAFLLATGSTLLRHSHYQEAKEHLSLVAEANGLDASLASQLGYCEQQQGNDQRAIYYFRQADMLSPGDEQTLFHLQLCYARQGRFQEQLQCLLQLEKLHPEEPKVLTETGLCLMQLQQWEEAQKRFFQMELRNQRMLPSMRAIAWCALRMKDYELAKRYYDRILGEELLRTKWEDFLNAGHTAWLLGDTPRALELYREYARRFAITNPEAKDILEPFAQDESILLDNGKSQSDIRLMHDLIARGL